MEYDDASQPLASKGVDPVLGTATAAAFALTLDTIRLVAERNERLRAELELELEETRLHLKARRLLAKQAEALARRFATSRP